MQILQQFKAIYFFSFLLSLQLCADDNYISFDQKFLKADWSFLPEVPAAFNESKNKSLETGIKYNNLKASFYISDMNLNLQRLTEPKDVSLNVIKRKIRAGYVFENENYLYITASEQNAKRQMFNCYQFSAFVIGGCEDANIRVSSINPKYEILGENIISIEGATDIFTIGYKKIWQNFWIDSTNIEFANTYYEYDWLSPLEDIQSPFILNLTINGVVFEDALNNIINRLPQREKWRSLQLNLGLKQKFAIKKNINLIAEHNLVFLDFSSYREYQDTPKFNYKLRGGFEFYLDKLSLLFYGDYYQNNLIGFEPITFNQRTEHHFSKPYGEIGISLKFAF